MGAGAAVKEARRLCITEGRAVLVETMTYRCVTPHRFATVPFASLIFCVRDL